MPCPLRGLPYREQLARKRELVVRALAARPSLAELPVDETIGSRDLFGYRNVAKLAVRSGRDGQLRAGVYEPGTHRLADAEACEVHHPAINEVLEIVLDEASRLGVTAYDEARGTGELRYLVVRVSEWRRRAWLTIVSASGKPPWARELTRRLAKRSRALGGVILHRNAEPGNVILGGTFEILRPPAELVEKIGDVVLQASPGAFLQVNRWTARRIYETVATLAEPAPGEIAADLFCGVGGLALTLAPRVARMIGIEEMSTAVADARANARRNGIGNTRFVAGRAEDVLPGLVADGLRPAIVTMNPPRKGVAANVLEAVAAASPRRILYISCDATTLARDLDRLAGLGYRTTRVAPFDMMPQT
ncbi:MAG: 23S rRNA (uracil(1939)-C(5))-methyltransferase RlmD, partial [Candidatus Binatia bacterium]